MSDSNSSPRFSRLTMLAATEVLSDRMNHADMDMLILELGLEETEAGSGSGLRPRGASLAWFATQNPERVALDGSNLWDAIVERSVEFSTTDLEPGWDGEINPRPIVRKFQNCLERDGFSLNQNGLVPIFPNFVNLPEAESEVHQLLSQYDLSVSLGHLNQAIDAHTRGSFASANAQIRTFVESFLDEICFSLVPEGGESTSSSHHRRLLLANLQQPFLSRELNEWDDSGKGFINGLFKRLHPAGSHPGLSDAEDSTFRLHIVLLTSRLLLRRFSQRVSA